MFCFTAAVMDECDLLHDKYENYCHSTDFRHVDCTAVLDNSANVHIIGDKRLFLSDIKPCPIGMDVGTVTGSNAPQGIATVHFYW